jgi:hypothetical protein
MPPKKPTPKPKRAAYDKYKAGQAAISRKRSAEGREIGPLPKVANPRRRARCAKSLRLYCETYRKATFALEWSADHLKAIAKLESAVLTGGLFALAMPRGSGKTSLCEAAVEWATLFGHRRFAALIGATEEAAVEMLDSIKIELETNDLLAADFPEVCYPVAAMAGLTNRGPGQTLDGERTRITWGAKEIVFPTVKGSKASGARIRVAGITGRVRGMKFKDAQGRTVRPDVAIADDPQTDESADSPIQTDKRERTLRGAVKGLAGPGKTIAMVVPCTVIAKNDLADRILDRDRHPQFQGERFQMMPSPPANAELWERYAELRHDSLKSDGKGEEATAFYRAHRAEMDAGAVVSWPARFDPETEASAVQAAMNLKLDNPQAFASEYQNAPEDTTAAEGVKKLDALDLAKRVNGSERFTVPPGCTRLTAFFDLGGKVHWWAVVAWNEHFGGAVVDYGCWPRQGRSVFAATDVRPGLGDVFPGMTEAQRVFAGLEQAVPSVLGREYPTAGGGAGLRVERCLIDAGKWPDAVDQFVARSPFAGAIYPSKGVGRSTTSAGVGRWAVRAGERVGHHWRLTLGTGSRRGRQIQFDPDVWKTFLWSALVVPLGGPHGLTLYGGRERDGRPSVNHELVAMHTAAEYGTPTELRGETFDKWRVRPGQTDNHWLDCLTGCAVAASVCGLTVRADGATGAPPPPKRSGEKLSDIQKRKLAGRAG